MRMDFRHIFANTDGFSGAPSYQFAMACSIPEILSRDGNSKLGTFVRRDTVLAAHVQSVVPGTHFVSFQALTGACIVECFLLSSASESDR